MSKKDNLIVLIDASEFQQNVLDMITNTEKLDKMLSNTVFDGDLKCKQAVMHGMVVASMMVSSCNTKIFVKASEIIKSDEEE